MPGDNDEGTDRKGHARSVRGGLGHGPAVHAQRPQTQVWLAKAAAPWAPRAGVPAPLPVPSPPPHEELQTRCFDVQRLTRDSANSEFYRQQTVNETITPQAVWRQPARRRLGGRPGTRAALTRCPRGAQARRPWTCPF